METNWNKIIQNPNIGLIGLTSFAIGERSGRTLTKNAAFTDAAGEVRSLLRGRKVTYARRLARKALRRRGIPV